LVDAVKGDDPHIIYVEGTLEGTATIRTGSNKSILGIDSNSHIIGAGILVKGVDNVIIRNLKIGLVREEHAEDAIAIDNATNVWVDHCDLYSDLDHGKDYYDGKPA
jgi:pectate lyase